MPDGTNVAGFGSNLFSAFNAKWSTATWEAAFQQAAATWEQVANINLVQVSDNGTPIGGGGYQQGDPAMGDIRISGLTSAALGTGLLAYTLLPPPINGGSGPGDIIVNTSQPWQINSDYDLLTVAIHEFGHALGMDHSSISTADMYATYNGIKQSLTADDTAGIDSIYGPRQPDVFMANFNNSTFANAFNLVALLRLPGPDRRPGARHPDLEDLRVFPGHRPVEHDRDDGRHHAVDQHQRPGPGRRDRGLERPPPRLCGPLQHRLHRRDSRPPGSPA